MKNKTIQELIDIIVKQKDLTNRGIVYESICNQHPHFKEVLKGLFNPTNTYDQINQRLTDKDIKRLKFHSTNRLSHFMKHDFHRLSDQFEKTNGERKYMQFLQTIDFLPEGDGLAILDLVRGTKEHINPLFNETFMLSLDINLMGKTTSQL